MSTPNVPLTHESPPVPVLSPDAPAFVLDENGLGAREQLALVQDEIARVDESASSIAFDDELAGAPRLSALGKRIELLRVERGISKQALARSCGTSRQQIWRVMTGKSELTTGLCQRLASVLDVDSRTLSTAAIGATEAEASPGLWSSAPTSLAHYLDSPALITRTLQTLPVGDEGLALKKSLLNAVEERARSLGLRVPEWLLRLRGSVLNGEL